MEGGKKISNGRRLELQVLRQNVSTHADALAGEETQSGRDVIARVGPIPAFSFEHAKGVAATRCSCGLGALVCRIRCHGPRWESWCESGGESMFGAILRYGGSFACLLDRHSTESDDLARGPRSSLQRCDPAGSAGWHETRR